MNTQISIKRVYEPLSKDDSFRILIDRLWPRGLKKEAIKEDVWLKEIAPSTALRKWFNHQPAKWATFSKKYKSELEKSPVLEELIQYCKKNKKITLLYAAKDELHNQAVVLQQFLNDLPG
ncbi:MAG: DUF488 domain-containing protein [Bacteroidota bacterium]